MSNSLAIASVTAALRSILSEIAGANPPAITAMPPNKARSGSGNQLNLFLYHVSVNPAWRNMDLPNIRPGESGHPPLAIDLFYMLTSFGMNDDDGEAHRLLGEAMRIFHDHPVLSRQLLQTAFPGADLHEQVERIRITHEPISVDDLFRVWATFQTEYRISVVYKVTVLLIESERPTVVPLPVLTRSIETQASLDPPLPFIREVVYPANAPSIQLGELLVLQGSHLRGDTLEVVFESERLAAPLVLSPVAGFAETELSIDLPDDAAARLAWRAGVYMVHVRIITGTRVAQTNNCPVTISPRISFTQPASAGDLDPFTLTSVPNVAEDQDVQFLVGAESFVLSERAGADVRFDLSSLTADTYLCRLRVDGIDSRFIDYVAEPPVFDPSMELIVP